jgi:hypothetical protein
MNLGYACINMSLGKSITTNRTMIKRTFLEKGLDYVSDCVIQNVADLEKIIDWNEQNGIKMYRMSSDMMPWATEYDFTQLKDWAEISIILKRCGEKATQYGQRLSFHPGPFNVLVSPKEAVVQNTINDLEVHGRLMDALGLSKPNSDIADFKKVGQQKYILNPNEIIANNTMTLQSLATETKRWAEVLPKKQILKGLDDIINYAKGNPNAWSSEAERLLGYDYPYIKGHLESLATKPAEYKKLWVKLAQQAEYLKSQVKIGM